LKRARGLPKEGNSLSVKGIIVHHSVCPSINGKGYDYFIKEDGLIVPAAERTDPDYIHICLEGDFSTAQPASGTRKEQLFLLQKLAGRLSEIYGFRPDELHAHSVTCPSEAFPWAELVISEQDRYH
jgi:hypothetical protein